MMNVAHAVDAARRSGLEHSTREQRALALETIAASLDGHRTELVPIAHRETHLSEARLDGEITRTAAQLRFFAGVVREGSYLEASIDSADPTTVPPRPELRRILRPLGPVAVFTASNFPFAFSVLGNDTASALAAGCPVVVKAHPGHPELSRRCIEIGRAALLEAGLDSSALTLVEGFEAGRELLEHVEIRAAGFTGSEAGGRALYDIAVNRPAPIPFYGELGSLNPVVLTVAAATQRGADIAAGLVASFTRDAGQYCTKPGVVFAPAVGRFADAVAEYLPGAAAGALLTEGMQSRFAALAAELATDDAVTVRSGADSDTTPLVLELPADALLARPEHFLRECFGPLTLIVNYRDEAQLFAALTLCEGSLTGTIHAEPDEDVSGLTAHLAERAGRVLFNGWPTGVAIAWSQHHGGPWPATTATVHTSVGATAIRRWLTPLTYQDAPHSVLPSELLDGPVGIPRRIDGLLQLAGAELSRG
ncbi:MAG TPA: aldehyde dehydrogenase (NADP(+)) [Microbacteriaceae bacterium]|nr:aldehyde dehydrogenase (NADP(+)) [Microbacteriaceae bacterium]